jgi:hypothetical protein
MKKKPLKQLTHEELVAKILRLESELVLLKHGYYLQQREEAVETFLANLRCKNSKPGMDCKSSGEDLSKTGK